MRRSRTPAWQAWGWTRRWWSYRCWCRTITKRSLAHLSTPSHHCPSHSWSRNHPLASLLLCHCCYTPIVNPSSLLNPRTLPNHCGRLKRSQYHPQLHISPIRSPSLPSCTLPEGLQHIPLWRSYTRTTEEDHHSLLLSFGVGCWLFWPLPSLRCTLHCSVDGEKVGWKGQKLHWGMMQTMHPLNFHVLNLMLWDARIIHCWKWRMILH